MSDHETNGRHIDGRFGLGNKISKGNIGNARMKELRRALLECGTPERVKAVEESLYKLAVGGEVAAIKVWLEHMVGKPDQAIQLTGADGSSLELPTVVAVIMAALGDNLEARVAVAAAFHRLGSGSGNGPDAAGLGA